jgi:hypothetical protein
VRAAAIVTLGLALLAPAPTAAAQARGKTRRCEAIGVRDGGRAIVTYSQVWAVTHPRRFGENAVLWTSVRGIDCDAFRALIVQVLLAPDERVALNAAGWHVTKVDRFRTAGVRVHQVHATKDGQRILYVRRGPDPIVREAARGRPYRPGQDLGFYRSADRPGYRSACTSGFVLRLPLTGTLLGLTAGHCSRYPTLSGSVWQTEPAERVDLYLGHRRRHPLGSVITNTELRAEGPDALVFALDRLRWAAQEIDRGPGLKPFRVVGVFPTARQNSGRTVCFTGRMSGGRRCGRIYTWVPKAPGPDDHAGRRLTCVRVKAADGDSGGPVYTRPNRRGEVRAVGIVTATRVLIGRGNLCYTPIETVLAAFGAELPTGAFAIAPPPR